MHFSLSSFSFLSRAVLGEGSPFPVVESVVSSVFSQVPKGIQPVGGWAFSERGGCSIEAPAFFCSSETVCVL